MSKLFRVTRGVIKNSIRGVIKFFSRGVANFKKSPIFTLKLHDLAISEEKILGGENFFWEVRFSKKISKKNVVSQKSKIQRGGHKALLEGVGSI